MAWADGRDRAGADRAYVLRSAHQHNSELFALHERPVALPLAIAHSGNGSPGIWRMYDDALDNLLKQALHAVSWWCSTGIVTTLVAGYLVLFHQVPPPDPTELMLARKRFELVLLSLSPAEYPTVADSARELVDAQFCEPRQGGTGGRRPGGRRHRGNVEEEAGVERGEAADQPARQPITS